MGNLTAFGGEGLARDPNIVATHMKNAAFEVFVTNPKFSKLLENIPSDNVKGFKVDLFYAAQEMLLNCTHEGVNKCEEFRKGSVGYYSEFRIPDIVNEGNLNLIEEQRKLGKNGITHSDTVTSGDVERLSVIAADAMAKAAVEANPEIKFQHPKDATKYNKNEEVGAAVSGVHAAGKFVKESYLEF